jgi:hypothetical protein
MTTPTHAYASEGVTCMGSFVYSRVICILGRSFYTMRVDLQSQVQARCANALAVTVLVYASMVTSRPTLTGPLDVVGDTSREARNAGFLGGRGRIRSVVGPYAEGVQAAPQADAGYPTYRKAR